MSNHYPPQVNSTKVSFLFCFLKTQPPLTHIQAKKVTRNISVTIFIIKIKNQIYLELKNVGSYL